MDKRKQFWTKPVNVAILAVLSSVLWGSAFPVLKWTYAELQIASDATYSQIYLAGLRFFAASLLVMLFFSIGMGQAVRIRRGAVRSLALLGLFQTSLQYFFFYSGVANTTGIKSAIMTAVGTFLVVQIAHFIYPDDKMNWGKVIGLVMGFLGVFVVNWHSASSGLVWSFNFRGEGFLFLSSLASVVGTFQAKKIARSVHPVIVNGWQLLMGSIVLLVIGYNGMGAERLVFTPLAWVLFVYSAFLSAAAFSIWYILLKYNRAGEVTMYRFMIPVSGALLSALFVPGETMTWTILAALFLVASGIVAVNHRGFKVAHTGEV